MTLPALVLPQININGTDRRSLVDQQIQILLACDNLVKTLAIATPNGRDYQYRPKEHGPAMTAWLARIEMVENLRSEIERHAEAIQA